MHPEQVSQNSLKFMKNSFLYVRRGGIFCSLLEAAVCCFLFSWSSRRLYLLIYYSFFKTSFWKRSAGSALLWKDDRLSSLSFKDKLFVLYSSYSSRMIHVVLMVFMDIQLLRPGKNADYHDLFFWGKNPDFLKSRLIMKAMFHSPQDDVWH